MISNDYTLVFILGIEVKAMEIGKVYQAPEPIVSSVQSGTAQQAGDKPQVTDSKMTVQQDFQVDLQNGLKTKLAEFAKLLQNRQELIQSLPEDIKKAVVALLTQMSAETELPQGLENLLKGQKNTAEQLKDMSTLLDFGATLQQDEHSEVKLFLQEIFENFTQQADKTPEQAAKELVQLGKQLPVRAATQGELGQALEQLLEQTLPENKQQLSPAEQKILVKFTHLLGPEIPTQLQQLAKQNNVPELPGVLTILKMADAWQFKDIQPKTLQAATDLLKQIAQEMSSEQGGVVTQLEQFVQSLLPEMSNKGTVVTQLAQFVQSLPPEITNKEMVVTQLEAFVKSLPPEINNKEMVVTQLEQFVKSLPPEIGNKETVLNQLAQFVKSLPTEIKNKNTVAANLDQFVKNLPPEIGKALEQTLKQGNIPNNLRALADTFSNAIVLNENMSSDLEGFVAKNVEKFMGKEPLLSAETNQVLTQLVKQLGATNTTVEQLKTLIQQLKTQLLASDPKLLAKEQRVVEQITKLLETNSPPTLQEGAVRHKLPDLPKMLVLLKALGVQPWQDIESQNLQKSASVVKELAQSISKATGLTGEKQLEHSTLSFSIPLQVAEGIYYPAHIHIYHEEKGSSSQLIQREFETWLRVSIDTDNIGMVDSVFRLYGDNKLDVRVTFPVVSAANQFTQDLPNVRKSLENSKLTLTDVMVNKS